jgi:hypothetical protein
MNVASSHEMSHVSYLNSKVYTKAGHDPWQRTCNLLVVICSSSELPKKTPNFSRNASKLFRRKD